LKPAVSHTRHRHSIWDTALADPYLSIIIPVYNEEKRLPTALRQVSDFIDQQTFNCEVVVVENGSRDRTLEIAEEFAVSHPAFQVLSESKPGKGNAIRRGMLHARGAYRFFCDVDFSMPVSEIPRFFPPAIQDVDITIASREAPGAVRFDEPQYRHLTGRVFNTLVRLLVLPGLHDTQCGFKCFRAEVAKELFKLQTLDGWSFDSEVLFIARRKGYSILEIPIPWYYNPDSRVRLIKDSYQMAVDMLRIRLNAMRGLYDRGMGAL
jgi:glycosyltransferase involved in cell wall biosynthesis